MKPYETKVDLNKVDKFETGAQRSAAAGKGRFDLIPAVALQRDALKYEQGAVAYGDRNWEKGMKFSRLIDSAMRHINQYRSGDRTEDHLAAARWNLAAIMHFEEFMPEMNDIPVPVAPAKATLEVVKHKCDCFLYSKQVCNKCQELPNVDPGSHDYHWDGPYPNNSKRKKY